MLVRAGVVSAGVGVVVGLSEGCIDIVESSVGLDVIVGHSEGARVGARV